MTKSVNLYFSPTFEIKLIGRNFAKLWNFQFVLQSLTPLRHVPIYKFSVTRYTKFLVGLQVLQITGKMEVLSLCFVLFNSGKIGVWLENKKVQNSSLRAL